MEEDVTEDEYGELLRHVRRQLDQIGRSDLDEFAFGTIVGAERQSDAFIKYAIALLHQVNLESQEGAVEARNRLNAALSEADAGFVDDILLVPSKQEGLAIQRDVVSLQEVLPQRAEFLEEFGRLVRELDAERDRS
jgi:hypothetical protein